MSLLALYIDEDAMGNHLVTALRASKADVLTVADAAMKNRGDEDQLRLATDLGRALYSFNVADFCAIHQTWMRNARNHGGMILAQQRRYSVGEQMRRLMRILESETAESMRNRVEFLSQWGAR